MAFAFPEAVIPDHVPADLVRPFPFVFGMTTDQDPFNVLAASVHEGP
ncbi:MAG: hypothetical protein Q8R81_17760 [Novosphingobium sp.]|nr:hypothetical protein [Novosphingobium sp.]MDP3552233.1 hypothetical protein [Novosphingobium sp.]